MDPARLRGVAIFSDLTKAELERVSHWTDEVSVPEGAGVGLHEPGELRGRERQGWPGLRPDREGGEQLGADQGSVVVLHDERRRPTAFHAAAAAS